VKTLKDTVAVDVPPDRVWEWITAFPEHYRSWHPDHVEAQWQRGAPAEKGSVLRVVERLGGRTERLRFRISSVDPPRRPSYRVVGLHGIFFPRGCFEITEPRGGSRFTATVECRFAGLTGRLFSKRLEDLQTHMREEGDNLKHLLEEAR
jgi:uncharacterized protein YndB with AHSA1/START domain